MLIYPCDWKRWEENGSEKCVLVFYRKLIPSSLWNIWSWYLIRMLLKWIKFPVSFLGYYLLEIATITIHLCFNYTDELKKWQFLCILLLWDEGYAHTTYFLHFEILAALWLLHYSNPKTDHIFFVEILKIKSCASPSVRVLQVFGTKENLSIVI